MSPSSEGFFTAAIGRWAVALATAVAVHAAVILGVSFSPVEGKRVERNTLDIVLVQHRAERPPDKADYLAQASHKGGGDRPSKTRPAAPLPAPFVNKKASITASPPPTEQEVPDVSDYAKSSPAVSVPDRPKREPILAVHAPSAEHPVINEAAEEPETQLVEERPPSPAVPPQRAQALDAASLVNRTLAMASLSAELDEKLKAYAKRPRRKFISAQTREYKYAAYMEAWRAKVERVGNLNYPDEARRRKLSGNLLLGVALNPDGTINDIVLRRSSGYKVLDDAAIRIVKLAAPFSPFPEDIRADTDILHIERTWQFLRSNRLASR